MKQVGVYAAKTNLPRLIEEVERGETVTITRHGKPVARLVPVDRSREDVSALIETILEEREDRSLGGLTIKELINEGRKY